MLTVSAPQMARLQVCASESFVETLVTHARETLPAFAAHCDDSELKIAIRSALEKARQHGWTLQGSARFYVEMALLFGIGFANDPFHAWFTQTCKANAGLPELAQADACYAALSSGWRRMVGDDGQRQRRAFERWQRFDPLKAFPAQLQVPEFMSRLQTALAALYPAMWDAADAEARTWLCAAAGSRLAEGIVPSLSGQFACLQFFLGHAALRDPLHPWVGVALLDPTTGNTNKASPAVALHQATLRYLQARLPAADNAVTPAKKG